ncbi:MAG: hypothetical protein WD960_07300 [Gemmatimonadota bacterium]
MWVATSGEIREREAPWRLSRRPVMRTGWNNGEPIFENLSSGGFAEDGTVVVGDQLSAFVWRFDLDGEVIQKVGGRGDGPGELGAISVVLPDGDSIFVQTEDREISLFGPDGFVRRFRSPLRDASLHGVSRHGDLLFATWVPDRVVDRQRRWVEKALYRRPRMGGPPDTLHVYPSSLTWAGARLYDPFAPFGQIAVIPGGFIEWRSDTPELRWYDSEGNLKKIARWSHDPEPVTDADWEQFASAYSGLSSPEVNPDPAAGRAHARELRPTASTERPVFGASLLVDSEGNVWLPEFESFYTYPGRYFVISGNGEPIGWIELPERFQPLGIAEGLVLGIERDEWDVQAVAVYEIRR